MIKQKETYVKLIARLIIPNRTSCVRGRKEFAEVAKESGVQWYSVGRELWWAVDRCDLDMITVDCTGWGGASDCNNSISRVVQMLGTTSVEY